MNTNLVQDDIRRIEKSLFEVIQNQNPIYEEIVNFLKSPSKRIRSVCVLLYLKAQNIEVSDNIIELLSAGELLHNASLLQDDVIDNSEERRGFSTLAKKFSDKVSILAGDILVSKAIQKIESLKNDKVKKLFLSCLDTMCEAEINQFLKRGNVPSFEEYLNVCKGKTATLFKTIFIASAELTGSDIKKAYDFSENFGIVFQIKNDLDSTSAKNDKKNGIYTAIDIIGIEKTNNLIDNYKEEMRSIIKNFPQNIYKHGLEDLIDKL